MKNLIYSFDIYKRLYLLSKVLIMSISTVYSINTYGAECSPGNYNSSPGALTIACRPSSNGEDITLNGEIGVNTSNNNLAALGNSNSAIDGGLITISENGKISGSGRGVIITYNSKVAGVVNNGEIKVNGHGIELGWGADGGIITGFEDPSLYSGKLAIYNSGTISSTSDVYSSVGITLQRASRLEGSIVNNGSILSEEPIPRQWGKGIYIDEDSSIEGNIINTENGIIKAGIVGIENLGRITGNIENYGQIQSSRTAGINNTGTIDKLINTGIIQGVTAAIDTSAGTFTNGINNYGQLVGNVKLGKNTLNLLGTNSTHSELAVKGNITGAKESTINIGNGALFTTEGDASVGEINIENGSELTLTSNTNWSANVAGGTGNFSNKGTITFDNTSVAYDATIGASNGFSNYGAIDLTSKNPNSNNNLVGNILTIDGNYVSEGGSIYLNTLLDDATSNGGQGTSDLIKITGNVTTGANGATKLYIIPTASTANLGQLTIGNGIKVIDVQGTSDPSDPPPFQLGRPVVAGAYEYTLGQGQTDDSWYLSSYYKGSSGGNGIVQYNPAMGAYLANQTAALQMFQQTLFDRLVSSSDGKNNDASKSLFWMRTKMTHGSYDSIHGNLNNRTRSYILQMGGDLNVWELNNGGYFHLGVMGGYGDFKDTSKSDTTGTKTNGKVNGYTAGIYGTYFANQDTNLGLYVDIWSQMGWYRNEVSGEAQQGTKKYNSTVWSNSVGVGYGIPLAVSGEYQWLATPQAQFTYNHYDADNQHDKNNLRVTNNNASGLDTRLGVRFHARGVQKDLIEPFLEVNWLNTTAKNELDFNGKSYKDSFAKDRFEAKVGLQANINKQWTMSAQMGGQWGNNSYNNYQGQLNLNYKF